MTEAELKDRLVEYLRNTIPRAIVFRHEDKNTAGIPDITITLRGRTLWLEVKFANPDIRGRGLQKLTCLRLSREGYCWFLIYEQKNGVKRTYFILPEDVVSETPKEIPDECMSPGFDHEFAAHFIRRVCGDYH